MSSPLNNFPSLEILIVDDNDTNRRVLQLMVKRLGFPSRAVVNGAEALAVVAERSFGAILMDWQMPVMDGVAATLAIRATHGGAAPPIVGISADATAGTRERCLAAGMVDFLNKPVTIEALRDVLARLIGLPAGQDQ